MSQNSVRTTRNILFIEDLPYGWKLFGKTGSGYQYSKPKSQVLQIGWFIGWIEKNSTTLIFAQYIEDGSIQSSYASLRPKDSAIKKITRIISKRDIH